MAAADPRDHAPQPRIKLVYHPMDKADKEFYGNRQMMEELLAKHVFGKVLPSEIVARLEIESMETRPTELRDSTQKIVRHVDLLWRVRIRGSWLYLILLFEAQSSVDWRMPLRILHETALVYQELSKDPEVRRRRTLPPVLPVVIYTGTRPWTAKTRLEELIAGEAEAFLPFALGQQYVLVPEAEEARALTRLDTPRSAALRLRYAQSRGEFQEAVAKLRELLPERSPMREALVAWARSRMIAEGTKEEHMERVRDLGDLESTVDDTWWSQPRREGIEQGIEQGRREAEAQARLRQRATLVRMARRKFGAETSEGLDAVLEGVADSERTEQIADLIIDCASGRDFLDKLADD